MSLLICCFVFPVLFCRSPLLCLYLLCCTLTALHCNQAYHTPVLNWLSHHLSPRSPHTLWQIVTSCFHLVLVFSPCTGLLQTCTRISVCPRLTCLFDFLSDFVILGLFACATLSVAGSSHFYKIKVDQEL